MKFTLEQKIKLSKLQKKVSNLILETIEENLPKNPEPTDLDISFKNTLTEIYQISPILADGYVQMYNDIQANKINKESSYLKRFRKANIW